jgi:hypothetical protein
MGAMLDAADLLHAFDDNTCPKAYKGDFTLSPRNKLLERVVLVLCLQVVDFQKLDFENAIKAALLDAPYMCVRYWEGASDHAKSRFRSEASKRVVNSVSTVFQLELLPADL